MADQWRIVPQGQVSRTELSPGGGTFRQVWEITFEVTDGPAKGTISKVRVPEGQHDAETIKAAIDAEVARLNAVAGL